jgi:hypothetical protein
MKTVSKPQHQVIWVLEILQIVADVDECISGSFYFECQYLIEPFQVASAMHYVGSQSYIYRKIGHYVFCPCRKSQRQLVFKRRFIESIAGIASSNGNNIIFRIDIGAAVVNAVYRDAGAQAVSDVVERGEIESHYFICFWRSEGIVVKDYSFAAPRTECNQVVTEVALKIGDGYRLCFFRMKRFIPVEIVYQ